VRVNEFLQSVSIPGVYAAGDAAASSGLPLAPCGQLRSADRGGKSLKGKPSETELPRGIPSVVFAIPPHSGRSYSLESEADEVINLFALAIRSGMRATDLKHMLFAYPTSGSNMARML
jgi:glutathione reductase (NADPH)